MISQSEDRIKNPKPKIAKLTSLISSVIPRQETNESASKDCTPFVSALQLMVS